MKTRPARRSYRMVSRAAGVAETRDRILNAAIAAFWKNPTTDIPLDEIASGAGVAVQTVLRHFGTKQGLMEAAGQRESERVSREREVAVAGDVREAVRVLVDHYEEMGDRVLTLLAEEHRMEGLRAIADTGLASHRAWCRRVFADVLADLDGVDRDRRLAQLVAVCDVYTWKLLRRDARLSRRQTELALVEMLQPLREVPR